MNTFEVMADVPEDRHVVIVLPPSVPTGKARLTVSVEAEESVEAGVKPRRSSLAKWAEENAEPRESSLADWVADCAEHMGSRTDSTDVEGFTGRRF